MAGTPHKPSRINLTVSIPVDRIGTDDKSVEVELADELVALVKSGSVPAAHRTPATLSYVTVNTASHASEEVHAAINRRVNGRNKPERFTLCDRQGKRIVTGLRHQPLEDVTCKQCRNQLVQDGMLDE